MTGMTESTVKTDTATDSDRDRLAELTAQGVSLWLDLFEMTFRAPKLIGRLRKDLPIHLIGGAEDPATNGGREVLWLSGHLKKNGLSNVTTKIWPATRHETLNDTVRVRAAAEFAAWAKAVLPLPTMAKLE